MFEIRCGLTGDIAEAETWEAALVAADTLAHDAFNALPIEGRLRAARESMFLSEEKNYCGDLTRYAREGKRQI